MYEYTMSEYCENCEQYFSHNSLDDDVCPRCRGWSESDWEDYSDDLDNTEEVKIDRKILL